MKKTTSHAMNSGSLVLFYSLALLFFGPEVIKGQVDSTLQSEDKRNVATLARNGDLPFIRQEWKKFVHPLTWQNGGGRLEDEIDKRYSHPTALKSRFLQEDIEKRFSHPTALQSRLLQDELEKRFSHPVALPSRLMQDELEKRFSHPVALPSRMMQDEIEKRFSHPVALPSRLLQEELEKRFSHPVALPSRMMQDEIEKRFSHPVALQSRLLQEELEKRFSHPVALPSRLIQDEMEKRFSHPTALAGSRFLQDEIEKRFSHPVALPSRLLQEELEKRFSHPIALPSTSSRFIDEALEKRFSHPITAALQSGIRNTDEELEKRFAHPLASAWQSGSNTLGDELDKRFVGSIARTGTLGSAGKRGDDGTPSEDELADALLAELVAEFLQRQQEEENELEEEAENSLEKRFVASLAKSGSLPAGKRNIAAMARDGYLTQHRPKDADGEINEDNEAIETLLDEVEKRHLGALARGFNMPSGLTSGGKRNVGALARSGLLARLSAKRYGLDEDKRNIATLLRGRLNGKRSPLRGQYLPFAYARLSGIRDSFADTYGKRNIQALLKSWRPADQYGGGHGQQSDEQKRHLGSLLTNKGFTVQKKSVDTTTGVGSNGSSGNTRSKRQVADEAPDAGVGSVEYPMPVLQGSDFYDFEEESPAAAEEKRFLGSLARSGWVSSRQVRSPVSALEENNRADLEKRHIGALARIGWLPAFRSTRFSRGKRSIGHEATMEDASLTWAEQEIRQRREVTPEEVPGDVLVDLV